MTRGKYANRAAGRREAEEVEATEAAYRRQIVRLTQERDEARTALAESRDAHAKESRILRAQVSEGTSGRVEALVRELERVRVERDDARRAADLRKTRNGDWVERIIAHFINDHDVKPGEPAVGAALALLMGRDDGSGPVVTDSSVERRIAETYGVEALNRIRAARGQL